jgi:hypothetical protein
MHSSYLMLLCFTQMRIKQKKTIKKIKKESSYEDLYRRSSTPDSEKTIIKHYTHPSVKIMNR